MATTQEIINQEITQMQKVYEEIAPGADIQPGTAAFELLVVPAATHATDLTERSVAVLDSMSIRQVLSQDDPDDELVTNLLSNQRVAVEEVERAAGYVSLILTTNSNTRITASAIITCGGVTLNPDKDYIGTVDIENYPNANTSTSQYVSLVPVGDNWSMTIGVLTEEPFTGVLSAGQVCTIDPAPNTLSSIALSSSVVGSSVDTPEAQLARAITGTPARVLTGRDQVKSLFLNEAPIPVIHAEVIGMGDDLMLRDRDANGLSTGGSIDVYVRTEQVPTEQELLITFSNDGSGNWTAQLPNTIGQGADTVLSIYTEDKSQRIGDVTITPTFTTEVDAPTVTEAIHARYSTYQLLDVAFTYQGDISSTAVYRVTVQHMPGLQTLQDWVESAAIRSKAFSVLVKGGPVIRVAVDMTVTYTSGADVPDQATMQQAIADAVNALPIGTDSLQASHIITASKSAFAEGTVIMPLNMKATVGMPDGRTQFVSDQLVITAPVAPGISEGNILFACKPGDVHIELVEQTA